MSHFEPNPALTPNFPLPHVSYGAKSKGQLSKGAKPDGHKTNKSYPSYTGQAKDCKDWCEKHKYRYVLVRLHSGLCIDGFIEHIDDQVVSLAVPYGPSGDGRAFVPFYPGFYPAFFPYPFYPRRRFYRQIIPLAGLLALSLLPFF
ncbi:hypothetical protein ACFSL6_04010 [Paenibacillus thailandensis]|uniref:Uncharacterized protein n=1 Tax=Paenibacillus thailandensis TaxID=393250 RepID=A0ABW5QZ02_9BACL